MILKFLLSNEERIVEEKRKGEEVWMEMFKRERKRRQDKLTTDYVEVNMLKVFTYNVNRFYKYFPTMIIDSKRFTINNFIHIGTKGSYVYTIILYFIDINMLLQP